MGPMFPGYVEMPPPLPADEDANGSNREPAPTEQAVNSRTMQAKRFPLNQPPPSYAASEEHADRNEAVQHANDEEPFSFASEAEDNSAFWYYPYVAGDEGVQEEVADQNTVAVGGPGLQVSIAPEPLVGLGSPAPIDSPHQLQNGESFPVVLATPESSPRNSMIDEVVPESPRQPVSAVQRSQEQSFEASVAQFLPLVIDLIRDDIYRMTRFMADVHHLYFQWLPVTRHLQTSRLDVYKRRRGRRHFGRTPKRPAIAPLVQPPPQHEDDATPQATPEDDGLNRPPPQECDMRNPTPDAENEEIYSFAGF